MGTIGSAALPGFGLDARPGSATFIAANSLLSLIPALAVGWLCVRLLEGVPLRSLGAGLSGGWLKNLLYGALFGCGAMLLTAAIASIFGELTFRVNEDGSSSSILKTLLTSLGVFGVAAAFEEALFRGYVFQTLLRSRHIVAALLLTSLAFATVHNANPSATTLSWANTFLAGIWFGVAYLKTRDLWFVFGLHWTWNWTQGAVLGIEVSGLTEILSQPLMREVDGGPEWLTGGSYGLEGGIACTAALFITTGLIWLSPFLKADEEMLAMTSSEVPAVSPGDQIV
jgi:membrane protease YdiL (CAAX protease family)